jgi:hypothetical protein
LRSVKALLLGTSALLLGSVACGFLVDSDGLTSGPIQAVPDGGGAQDGTTVNPTDGAPVTNVDAATPSGRFCEAHADAIFCEDFDGPALAVGQAVTQNGTGIATATNGTPSPPNAFVAQVAALTSGQQGYAVFRPPDVALTKFHVAFDVSVVGGPSAIVFNLIAAPTAGTNSQSELLGTQSFAVYQEFFQNENGDLTNAFNWGSGGTGPTLTIAWKHVDVCFDFSQNHRSFAFDGKQVAQGEGVTNWPGTGTLSFGSFLVSDTPSTLQEVHIDNVVVDTNACPP